MLSRKYIVSITALFFASLPFFAFAQSGFVPCLGVDMSSGRPVPDCNACHLVAMGNSILIWLIGVMFVIFAVMIFAAGWGLVTSGGNPEAKSAGKAKLMNAVIGLIIVLAAWIIVDTVMRGLVVGDGDLGAVYSGFGPWSSIHCVAQPSATVVVRSVSDTVTSAPMACAGTDCSAQQAACTADGGTATVDSSDPANHVVYCETSAGVIDPATTRVVCDVGPSGDRVLCAAQEAACTASGGTPEIDTSNPTQYEVVCTPDTPTAACGPMSSVSLFGFNATVDSSIVSRLSAINSEWQSRGGNSYYRVYSVGAYNCRTVTGGEAYSVHAYGLAVDINPRDNGYVSPRPASGCPTNMPSSFVGMFKSRGFGWGGDWRSLCDAMHMSDAAHEGGSQNIR